MDSFEAMVHTHESLNDETVPLSPASVEERAAFVRKAVAAPARPEVSFSVQQETYYGENIVYHQQLEKTQQFIQARGPGG